MTSIGLDHTEYLGATLEEIAREKAGIFKPGAPAVIGERDRAHSRAARRARAREPARRAFASSPTSSQLDDVRVDDSGTTCDIEWNGERATLRTPLAGRASGVESRVLARDARRRRRAFATRSTRRSASRTRSHSRAISARRAVHLRRRAQSGGRRRCSRRRVARCRRPTPIAVVLCVLARQGLARDDSRARAASRRRFILTIAPTAPASRAWDLDEAAAFARELGLDADVDPDFRRALDRARRARRRRCSSPARSTPSAMRCRCCRCRRWPGSFRRMAQGALPGFRDFYPEQFAERAHIMGVWRDVARRFAFVEYDGPPLEPLELYTKKSGDEIVGQLYNFTDKGGREVALRPEMTPTLARMVAAKANALRKPVRWFSMPQLFRYERQQRGRLREHFQLNVDIIGEADVTADAELLAVAIEIMRGCGLTSSDVRARVSDRRLLRAILAALGVTDEQAPAVFGVIDKIDRQPRDVSREKLGGAGHVAPSRSTRCSSLHGRRHARRHRDAIRRVRRGRWRCVARLRRYFDCLDALGVLDWVTIDLKIVRGLAYYTGIVFELFDAKGELRAICGGGRYDNLLQSLGGVDLPALGFGMGDVVLAELLRDRGLLPSKSDGPQVWVASESLDIGSATSAARRRRCAAAA